MNIRILLADDHGVVRKGLRFLLERQQGMEVVGEAADGREAVRLAETTNPDIVIMDVAHAAAERHRGHGADGQAEPENRGDHPEHALGRRLPAFGAERRRQGIPAERARRKWTWCAPSRR